MSPAIEPLVVQLQAAGLMTVDEAQAWFYRLAPAKRPANAATMAAMLVDSGKLTQFQADELLAGRGQRLCLGDYTLEERLGIGATGQVYRARHRKMNRVVALKVLQPTQTLSAEMISRFHREVQAAARLIHPHIVAALDASEHNGLHYLVMEYVEGSDLAQIVRREGALGVRRVVDYMLQAARGLDHAHGEGIVHRDIKPGNLLVDKRGMVKILDLGAARMENVWGEPIAEDDEGLTHTGNILGTVDYMAPEQALNLRSADGRADIYALGCTMYRLLTNQRIYPGETVLERILAHREQPIPRLGELCAEVPETLEVIFQRMVAKRPQDRYTAMGDLIHDLEQLLETLPEPAPAPPVEPATDHPAETAETVWADSPAALDDPAEASQPVEIVRNAEPSHTDRELTSLTEQLPSVEPQPIATAASVTPESNLPSSGWLLPLAAALIVMLIAGVSVLPAHRPVLSTTNTQLEELKERERFIADPQFSERALERMRREFQTFTESWEREQAEWRESIERELTRASAEGGFHVVPIPAGDEHDL